jgi:hypothetical protein
VPDITDRQEPLPAPVRPRQVRLPELRPFDRFGGVGEPWAQLAVERGGVRVGVHDLGHLDERGGLVNRGSRPRTT